MTHDPALRRALTLAAMILPLAVLAQRADENAVTAADDAFGTTIGSQSIGLYDAEHVRGFSPRAAGNLRIEGLYFDLQTFAMNDCLATGATIRVGLAAQSFDTPSPTGIANYTLHATGPESLASVVLSRGPFLSSAVELDGQRAAPGGSLSASLCFHARQNPDLDFARRSHSNSTGVVVRWRPAAGVEVIPFWGTSRGSEHDELPTVFINGLNRPPAFIQRRLPTQGWTQWHWSELTAGLIVRSAGSGPWAWSGGLFRSTDHSPGNYSDLFIDLDARRMAEHVVEVTPPLRPQSTSGEIRILHRSASGSRVRLWSIALRGKNAQRNFGGDATVDLGRASIDDHTAIPKPTLVFRPESGRVDRVRQLGLGVSFEQRWTGRGSISVGAQKVDYRRTIAALSAATSEHSTPTLANIRFTLNPRPQLVVYGSYTRGLEDSAPAPPDAAVAFATAPATATWQVDAGMRFTPRPGVQIVAGVFKIQKAYFNLDGAGNYGQLGQIRHSGVETSATISGESGLTAVLGGVWLRPGVQLGPAVVDPQGGIVLGVIPLLLDADLDYAPARWGPWSLGVRWNRVSSRPALQGDLPPYWMLSFTARYRLALFGRSSVARLDAEDVNDATDLRLLPAGAALPEQGRRLSLTFATDL